MDGSEGRRGVRIRGKRAASRRGLNTFTLPTPQAPHSERGVVIRFPRNIRQTRAQSGSRPTPSARARQDVGRSRRSVGYAVIVPHLVRKTSDVEYHNTAVRADFPH